MLMFRFWNSDHRGSDKTLQQVDYPMLDFAKPVQPWISTDVTVPISPPKSSKRRRQSNAAIASHGANSPSVPAAKRSKAANDVLAGGNTSKVLDNERPELVTESTDPAPTLAAVNRERMVETIEEQFGLEILLKHDELRLINQELAKCQVALEQLRRCHLIPYPVNVPTPEQMLAIADGTGHSLQPKDGKNLPQWAPPFGVTDGPYSRHYAKWLIPDPKFDGIQPEIPAHGETWRVRSTVEGRSTRNSTTDFNTPQTKGGRPSRSTAGQKLHALSSGYPVHKDKNGPCVLKRADGQTVKLVCIDCHRENFSSTQGFINHCRIAHKRDFKSHEEAAVASGHPIKVSDVAQNRPVEEKPAVYSAPPSGIVHPFVRENTTLDPESFFSVARRIEETMALYHRGKLASAPSSTAKRRINANARSEEQASFSPSTSSPHLSQLLQSKGFDGNLDALVVDAQTKVDLDMMSQTDDDSDDQDSLPTPTVAGASENNPTQTNTGVRVPSRAAMTPTAAPRPLSSKGSLGLARPPPFVTPVPPPTAHLQTVPSTVLGMDEDMMDATELSPNMPASNNAPSLVSDDGEYDDSADSDSASEMDDSIGAAPISDVDDMDIDDDHTGARALRHHGSGAGAGTRMRLARGETKHVNFVGPVKERETARGRGIDIDTVP